MRFTRLMGTAALGMLAACSDSASPGNGSSLLTLQLTDAPGDVTAAVVTIDEIYLQGADGRVTLRSADTTLNLLDLTDTSTALLSDVEVPSGAYEQLRFVISGGYIEVEEAGGTSRIYASSPAYAGLPDGATVHGDLQMPSFAQSGLKVEIEEEELDFEDESVTLLVDFDVSRSFGRQAGNSGKWVMRPVVKGGRIEAAAVIRADVTVADTVTLPTPTGGTEAAALDDFRVRLVQGTTTVAEVPVVVPDATKPKVGFARFVLVAPGTYGVQLVAPTGVTITTREALPVSVDAVAGATRSTPIQVTSARPTS